MARALRGDVTLATVEIALFVGALAAVVVFRFEVLVHNGFAALLIASCAALSTSLQVGITSSTTHRASLGVGAAMLGLSLSSETPWLALMAWATGIGIGWSVIRRDVVVGARVAGRSTVVGAAYLLVWSLFGFDGSPILPGVVAATAAYMLVALLVMSLPVLLDGVSFRRYLAELLVRRLLALAVLNMGLTAVVVWIRAGTRMVDPSSFLAISNLVSIASVAATITAVAMVRLARVARQRLDGVFDAALSLPWPADADADELMRRHASRALTTERVGVRTTAPDPQHEIGAEFRTPDGELRYLVARRRPGRSPFLDRDVQTLSAIAHIAQEAMRVRSETLGLLSEARTDPLTGLPNYRAFQGALTDAAKSGALGVVYLDLDNFKAINDAHGHEVGNRVLQIVARRMERAVRPSDLVARVGGDEFVVILTGVDDLDHAETIAARLVRTISPPILLGETIVALTFSTGVSFSADDSHVDPVQLVDEADARMYSSRGRAVAGAEQASVVGDAGDTVRAVAEAIDGKLLTVHYQPIVDNVMGRIVALEALVRAVHPELGPIPPNLLIHEATRTGRLDFLTSQVLETVVGDSARIRELVPELREIHVNVEVDQLTAARILPQLDEIVREHPALELTLEMTENSLNRATDLQRADLTVMKGAGLRFALDDFGQAYSTMLAIVQYPFDTLKVDRVLVSEAAQTQKSRQVLRSLVLLSRKLDVTMVVEGIETVAERDRLAKLGVRYMQGFLFARPESLETVLERLRTNGVAVDNATRPEL